jgi:hypothetical protein
VRIIHSQVADLVELWADKRCEEETEAGNMEQGKRQPETLLMFPRWKQSEAVLYWDEIAERLVALDHLDARRSPACRYDTGGAREVALRPWITNSPDA